jgi:hypothetical protein
MICNVSEGFSFRFGMLLADLVAALSGLAIAVALLIITFVIISVLNRRNEKK